MANFPHSSVQIVDSQGRLTREGSRFLQELWERTGGANNVLDDVTTADNVLSHTTVDLLDGAAAASATLTNAPSAGNPSKWVPVDDNGTTRYIPAW